MIMFPIGLVSS